MHLFGTIDLEDSIDPFIISTKRLILKEYPDAFNPSIIRWNEKLLMTFRIIPNPLFSFNSKIGIVELDENFEPISAPQLINTRDMLSIVPSRAEDARLIVIDQKLYMIYSDNTNDYISKEGFRVYISEIDYVNDQYVIKHSDCLKHFEGATPLLREKNWVPFDYQGTLFLAYSLMPHKIFQPILGSENCETIATTTSNISWEYGELRGGTPALLVRDQYLSFFHSSTNMLTAHSNHRVIAHYFMGAYTFSKEPPFEIQAISQKPIIGKNFYKGEYYKPYWKSVRCVFPCGILIEDPFVYITYGRQDHEIWIATIDLNALLESLIPVEKLD